MNDRMKSSSDEALGMRVFEVSRQRAVERCIQRWRNGLKADWLLLSQDDIENLRWMAGELWATRTRDEWDSLHFSKLDLGHTREIVSCADRLRRHGVRREQTLAEVVGILDDARLRGEESARVRSGELLV
ncbi:MAG: hypothetical protein ABFC80_05580 [Coriobacteriales bacterium]